MKQTDKENIGKPDEGQSETNWQGLVDKKKYIGVRLSQDALDKLNALAMGKGVSASRYAIELIERDAEKNPALVDEGKWYLEQAGNNAKRAKTLSQKDKLVQERYYVSSKHGR